MDEPEGLYTVESEEQLWDEIQQVVQRQCAADSHESIDDALRNWLYLASRCRDAFSHSEDDVALCSEKLLAGTLFQSNPDYVRIQIIYSLLQEDDGAPLYAIATFLLLDGRNDEDTYRKMVGENCGYSIYEADLAIEGDREVLVREGLLASEYAFLFSYVDDWCAASFTKLSVYGLRCIECS